jgi:hypothetical protein
MQPGLAQGHLNCLAQTWPISCVQRAGLFDLLSDSLCLLYLAAIDFSLKKMPLYLAAIDLSSCIWSSVSRLPRTMVMGPERYASLFRSIRVNLN